MFSLAADCICRNGRGLSPHPLDCICRNGRGLPPRPLMLIANSNSHSMDLIWCHRVYERTAILGSVLLSCSRLHTYEQLLQRFCAPDRAPSPCVKQGFPSSVHLRTASFQAHIGSTAVQHISAVIPKQFPKAASRTGPRAEHADRKPQNSARSTTLARSTSK